MKEWMMAAMLMVCVASAAEEQNPLAELDAKIKKSLSSDKWNEASTVFARSLWKDYTNAHVNPAQETTVRGLYGKMPDVKDPDEYIGAYGGTASSQPRDLTRPSHQAPALTISRSEDGRFFVELEGHRIPAVIRNRSIVFTTGDVVYSEIPSFGGKPYCTLEMFMVLRADGKFYFAAPGMPPDKWREMTKRETPK